MKKLGIVFAVLTIVAMATSAQAFVITNVTNDEVVFNCSWEQGTAGENIQTDTPEIGTFRFDQYGQWPPVLGDTQADCWVEDETTTGVAAYQGNNYAHLVVGAPYRPHATSEFVGTPGIAGDLMRMEFAVMSIIEWPAFKLYETPPDVVYTSPEYHRIADIYFTGDPPYHFLDPGWTDPGGIISIGEADEYILDAHTVGEWNEVVMEYVNGSTELDMTVNGVPHTLTNMKPGILNYVRLGNCANNTVGYFDALGDCENVDWNNDGVIDDLDLTELAVHWQQSVPPGEDGDADGDGFVDDLDLTALAVCWPTGDLDVSAVPEPATLSLLASGGLALILRRRR